MMIMWDEIDNEICDSNIFMQAKTWTKTKQYVEMLTLN